MVTIEERTATADLSYARLKPVCPACRGALGGDAAACRCASCGNGYVTKNGVFDFSLGTTFGDEEDCCKWDNEDNTGRFLVQSYLSPLLDRLFKGRDRKTIRVLSVGCGVGKDVEVLNAMGFEAYGIDPGNRTSVWQKREGPPQRYFLAGAEHLPFEDASFDFAFMNCVLPHIGVDNDSYTVVDGFDSRRQKAALEVARVMKPGGWVLAANPNRLCPLDLFHRPHIARHKPRLHGQSEPFLLSYADHRRLFVERAAFSHIEALPITNYWGFFLSSRYWFGKLLQAGVKGYFSLLSSRLMRWARPTGLNPWLVVLMRK